jgi:hypothetical protein
MAFEVAWELDSSDSAAAPPLTSLIAVSSGLSMVALRGPSHLRQYERQALRYLFG